MSRELKFRAWIPDIERIYQAMSVDVEPQDGRQKYVTCWEHPCVKSAIIKGKVGKFRLGDGVVLMQYMDMSDINGIDIYEGDICEYQTVSLSGSYIGLVNIETGSPRIGQHWLSHINYLTIKIIGNIHQNPDLLEQQ